MKKAVLINIPLTESLYPSASLAAISPVFRKRGYDVNIVDLNVDLFEQWPADRADMIYDWCQLTAELDERTREYLTAWLSDRVLQIVAMRPDVVALSVFSLHSIVFADTVLPLLKTQLPHSKLIVGGSGVSSNLGGLTDHRPYGEYLLAKAYCDHVIFGEGEISLGHLLDQQPYPGIDRNDAVQIDNLDLLDPPDYTPFEFGKYRDNRLLITGSRGCVRHCTFCDIDLTWPQFRFRSPESQVREITEHCKIYGVKRFEFTDSLINGSVTNWIRFNELLANAKQCDAELADITYSGQFICRDQQSQPSVMYELMHYAGARQITVGIESFSERVRTDMKKRFSNTAIDYHLEQCGRWAIPNIFLMIVGYPSETTEDHRANMEALSRYKIYSDMGVIFMIRWGLTMHIYRDTPLFKNANQFGIDITQRADLDAIYTWTSTLNPDLNFVERVRRRLELYLESHRLGYSQPNARSELAAMASLLSNYKPISSRNFEIKALP